MSEEDLTDDEPQVQHVDKCEHPAASCTCPRDHLLNEARRIREMCLFAEAEFARENQRAVDLKIERDGWRSENDRHRALYVEAVKERDRLRGRVAWLRRAYGKAWLRRRSMHGIIRDVDNARRSAKDERDRLRAVVDGDDRLWAHVVMQIMLTIDGGRRTWGDPLAGQVISAVADLEAERDRLRAVVDALVEWRDAEMRLTTADIVADISDHRDLAETTRQNLWLVLARWEEQLDVSPTGEDA